jgi:glycosyltransferase involved in cell wall biosynthesis
MRWVVAQAGACPELVHAAAALGKHGDLQAYIAPTALVRSHPLIKHSFGSVKRVLERRVLPTLIEATQTARPALAWELLFESVHGRGMPRVETTLLSLRSDRYFGGLRSYLESHDDQPFGLILQSGAPAHITRLVSAMGIAKIVNSSQIHDGFFNAEIKVELSRHPLWSETLLPQLRPTKGVHESEFELSQADYVLVQSDFQRRCLTQLGIPDSKLVMIPLGVDLSVVERTRSTRRRGPLRVGFLGQLTQRKGLADLHEAYKRLRMTGGIELIVAGVRIGDCPILGDSAVTYRGSVSHVDLSRFFDDIDVLVCPSVLEGFSLAPVEAMRCGVPVVVSDRMYISDKISQGIDGWVFAARDVEALTCILGDLMNAPPADLNTVGARGRSLADTLTWDDYRDRLRGFLRGVDPKMQGNGERCA